MSGCWIKLHDVRVNVLAQTERGADEVGDWYAGSHVATCLDNLYNVLSIVDACDCPHECDCVWTDRDHGD